MIFEIGGKLVSGEALDTFFVCDLQRCRGACCVEGDLGAPLEEEETHTLVLLQDRIRSYLSLQGLAALDKQGPYVLDEDGDLSTPTVGGRECVYAVCDERGALKCGIEEAWRAGQINFRKPISCHLYPIRVTQNYIGFEALNYHQWGICASACRLGQALRTPLYVFLKDALIRKYGAAWYSELEDAATEWAHRRAAGKGPREKRRS